MSKLVVLTWIFLMGIVTGIAWDRGFNPPTFIKETLIPLDGTFLIVKGYVDIKGEPSISSISINQP